MYLAARSTGFADVDIKSAIEVAAFRSASGNSAKLPIITDVFWPREELYRAGKEGDGDDSDASDEDEGSEETE